MKRLDLPDTAALRIGLAPYTDDTDVDRLLTGLAEFSAGDAPARDVVHAAAGTRESRCGTDPIVAAAPASAPGPGNHILSEVAVPREELSGRVGRGE